MLDAHMGLNTVQDNLSPVEALKIGENVAIKHTEATFLKVFNTLMVMCRDSGVDHTEVGLLSRYHWDVHNFGHLSHSCRILSDRVVTLDVLSQLYLDVALEKNDGLRTRPHYLSDRLHNNLLIYKSQKIRL